ncbi:MAG: hypothetical protein OEY97_00720 [Nitrospirota bacterium]|nr:hypothetical protein [Nitrospirota bacterium]
MYPSTPPRPDQRSGFPFGALLAAVLLSGCAGWSGHGVTPEAGEFHIVLLPARVTAQVGKLSELTEPPAPPDDTSSAPIASPSANEAAIQAELAAAAARITGLLAARLDASPALRVWVAPTDRLTDASGHALPPAEVARAVGAAAALELDISGYGKLKPRWVTLLLAKGAVEATLHAVVAWQVLDNPWAAAALFVEELAVETLTWGGSAKLFNAHYSPVILEARLRSASDGKTVWSDMVVVPTDRKALKRRPEVERKRREVQLEVTSERAVRRLAKGLEKTARRRISASAPRAR